MVNLGKIILTFLEFAGVDDLASSKDEELVEQSHNVASRLMDGEDDCSVVVPGERGQGFDDIVRVKRIKPWRCTLG